MTTDQPDTTIDSEVDFWCIMHGIADAGLKSDLKNFISTKIAQEANKARAEAYDQALYDSGYLESQVGPITKELVISTREKLRKELTADKGMS